MRKLTLVGYGAIGRSLHARLLGHAGVQVSAIVVPQHSVARVQAAVGESVKVSTVVPKIRTCCSSAPVMGLWRRMCCRRWSVAWNALSCP